MFMKKICSLTIAIMLLGFSNDAQGGKKGGSSSSPSGGRSSFSGGSSSGGKSSFSGGRSSFGSTTPTSTPTPTQSKPPSFSGGSTGVVPGKSSSLPSSESSNSNKITSTTQIAGKVPTKISTKPAASNFDSLAGKDSKKAESRMAYEASKSPAPTYKTPTGKEVKIDPKDKQIENLRGRLNEQRWVNRTSRENTFYQNYNNRPVIVYNDCYHPMWNYWLLSQSLDVMSMWCYHHQASMDQARLNEMYAQNAGLRARVAALEAQKITRDPTYMPPNVDPDLAYNDSYVNAVYNPRPKIITEYEYAHERPSIGAVLLWIFVYIPSAIIMILAIYYLIFVYRW